MTATEALDAFAFARTPSLALVLAVACVSCAAQGGKTDTLKKSIVTSNSIKEFRGSLDDLVDFEIDLRVGSGGPGSPPTFLSDYSVKAKKPQTQLFELELGTEVTCPSVKGAFAGVAQSNLNGQSAASVLQLLTTPGLQMNAKVGTAVVWINVSVRETPAHQVVSRSFTDRVQINNCP
jgi:hypothetical protein